MILSRQSSLYEHGGLCYLLIFVSLNGTWLLSYLPSLQTLHTNFVTVPVVPVQVTFDREVPQGYVNSVKGMRVSILTAEPPRRVQYATPSETRHGKMEYQGRVHP